MFVQTTLMWSVMACFAATADTGRGTPGSLCVTLASCKDEYALGEPVLLVVSAKNISTQDVEGLTVYLDEGEPEITLFISTDGEKFERYKIGCDICRNIERHMKVLAPRQAWTYRLRVVYARAEANRLAFPRPGHYWVKAVYPLMGRRPSHPSRRKEYEETGREEYESNSVEIDIKEPLGVDATMWKTVQEPAFLRFLQPGSRFGGDPAATPEAIRGIPAVAAKLLESVPYSSYHEALRFALQELYDGRRDKMTYLESQKDRELTRIRFALGIEELPPGPFPEDARLDVTVTYEFPEETPLALALEQLSWQSRVPLSADPKVAGLKLKSLKVTESLRDFMDGWDGRGAEWESHGNGYRLVPTPFVLPPGLPGGAKQK